MPKQVQLRRGTTAQTAVFTGALGEVTVDTDKKTVVVHDGSTAGGTPLAREGLVLAKANNLLDVGSKSAARSSLDVLWADDSRALFSTRMPRGGLYFDGTAAYQLNGATGLNLGLMDFTIALVVQLVDYTPASNAIFWTSHNAGGNYVQFYLHPTGAFKLRFFDGVTSTDYVLTPDVALVDGEAYHVVVSVTRAGNAVLYINGISDRDASGGDVTVSVAAHSTLSIGSGNANPWGVAHTLNGALFGLRVFNRALSASDVLGLVKAGMVAYADEWGSMTAAYTSDFSATADSWAAVAGDANIVLTANQDGINGSNDWLKVARATSIGDLSINRSFSVLPRGHRKIKVSIYNNAGSGISYFKVGYSGLTGSTPVSISVPAGTQVDCDFEFSHPSVSGTNLRIEPCDASGNLNTTVAVGAIYYVKAVQVYDLGAILDVDVAEADPAQSLTVRDRTSNANHGTAAASGVTQFRRVPQGNLGALTVGGSAVLKKLLSATAPLDFPSMAAGASQDLPVTVTGAAVGDCVALGLPSSFNAQGVYQAWVSAVNTVTIRCTNISSSLALDPVSATFRVVVFSF